MAKSFIIGVDLGGTSLRIALFDVKYKIRRKYIFDTARFLRKDSLVAAIITSVNKIIQSEKLNKCNILGVGLGLPGPINAQKGLVHFFPNIPGWNEVGLKKILERKLGLPVYLDNDVNLMALAEYAFGAAKGARNVVCLTLGTGVGGGIIIDAKLYRGSAFAAGEIGHIPINEKGPKCNCGGQACLEAYIGNKRIIQEAKKIFKRQISLEELSAMARRKNQKAIGIWREVGRRLGIALCAIINSLNPDIIVMGGGVAEAGPVLFNQVKKTILERAMPIQARHVRVHKAKLGSDAGLIGAAILVREGSQFLALAS